MAAHVLGRATMQPEKVALTVMGRRQDTHWSYAKLEAAVRGTGTGLLRLGLKAGDILLLRLGNTPEFPIAYLGAIAVGVIPVPCACVRVCRWGQWAEGGYALEGVQASVDGAEPLE